MKILTNENLHWAKFLTIFNCKNKDFSNRSNLPNRKIVSETCHGGNLRPSNWHGEFMMQLVLDQWPIIKKRQAIDP